MEIIADNPSKAGWSWGRVSAVILRGERSGGLLTRSGSARRRVRSSREQFRISRGVSQRENRRNYE